MNLFHKDMPCRERLGFLRKAGGTGFSNFPESALAYKVSTGIRIYPQTALA